MLERYTFLQGMFIGARAFDAPEFFSPEDCHKAFDAVVKLLTPDRVSDMRHIYKDPVFNIYHEINSGLPEMMYSRVIVFNDSWYKDFRWCLSGPQAGREFVEMTKEMSTDDAEWLTTVSHAFATGLHQARQKTSTVASAEDSSKS